MAGVTVCLIQLDDELNEMVPVLGVNLNSPGCRVHAAMPRYAREGAQDGRTVRRSNPRRSARRRSDWLRSLQPPTN